MTGGIPGAIRFFQTRTLYLPLPAIALLVFAGAFLIAGVLYGAGFIRWPTYVAVMVGLSALFALVLIASLGAYFFVRVTR